MKELLTIDEVISNIENPQASPPREPDFVLLESLTTTPKLSQEEKCHLQQHQP